MRHWQNIHLYRFYPVLVMPLRWSIRRLDQDGDTKEGALLQTALEYLPT